MMSKTFTFPLWWFCDQDQISCIYSLCVLKFMSTFDNWKNNKN